MESTERDLAVGNQSGGLGADGGEIVTAPVIPEPEDVPAPPESA